jgi:hypothetical protein
MSEDRLEASCPVHSQLVPSHKNAPHLLFTSQPLEEFQKAFNDATFIKLGSAVSTGDIRSFVHSKVLRVRNLGSDDRYAEHVMEQIVQKSNRMSVLSPHCNLSAS